MIKGTQIYPWEGTNFISYFWFLESRVGQKGHESTEMKVFLWLFLIHEKSLTRKESKGKLSGKKKRVLCAKEKLRYLCCPGHLTQYYSDKHKELLILKKYLVSIYLLYIWSLHIQPTFMSVNVCYFD